ncbi:hypothetical protein D3C76_1241940 [compost metagenome]
MCSACRPVIRRSMSSCCNAPAWAIAWAACWCSYRHRWRLTSRSPKRFSSASGGAFQDLWCSSPDTSPGPVPRHCWCTITSRRLRWTLRVSALTRHHGDGRGSNTGACMGRRASTTALMNCHAWNAWRSSCKQPLPKDSQPGASSTTPPAARHWAMP